MRQLTVLPLYFRHEAHPGQHPILHEKGTYLVSSFTCPWRSISGFI